MLGRPDPLFFTKGRLRQTIYRQQQSYEETEGP